jgi:ABC-2 type transport system ATP-binding protein
MPSAVDVVVDVVDLVKRYGAKTAVDGLSLRVLRGTVTAVLGPNGAGKTTTVECCEGYRRPDAGSVRVLGLDPVRDGEALRPRVGVMLQSGGIPQGVRAVEMLRHVAKLHAHPLPVDLLVERLGLQSAGSTPYRRLSGGQRQRLSLALAVVGRPEVVFLDEPTAGLDPHARQATWDLIRDLRSDGVSIVLTTHLMDEAERLSDAVVVVDAGKVVASGSPAELTASGTQESLTFNGPPRLDLSALARALDTTATASEVSPGSYRIEGCDGTVDAHMLATVTAWCAAHGVMPEGLTVARRTLEDVFLEVTGRQLRS